MMKLASLSMEGDISSRSQHRALRERAALLQQQRDSVTKTPVGYDKESREIESAHFDAIVHKAINIIDENTYPDEAARYGKPWKPLATDPSYVLIAGDAGSHGFRLLRRALASHERLGKLIDLGSYSNATSPDWISAEGAVRGVKEREYLEDDGTRNWAMHDEL